MVIYWTCYDSMVDGVSTDSEQVVTESVPENTVSFYMHVLSTVHG